MSNAGSITDSLAAWVRRRPPLWSQVAVYAAFACVLAFSAARTVRSLHDPAVGSLETPGLFDFHNGVYYPAVAFRDGVNPYSQAYADQYPVSRQLPLYSSALLWLHYPFALMPIDVSGVVYYVFSLSLVVALAASILYVCRLPLSAFHIVALTMLILLSRPGHTNLLQGQITLPMVLGALWAMELARRKPKLAGVALAFTTFKPTFFIPIAWLMFCRRDFRAVFYGTLIGVLAATAGAAPFVAREGLRPFVVTVLHSHSLHGDDPIVLPTTSWTRVDALGAIGRLTNHDFDGRGLAIVAAATLLLAGLAVVRTSGIPAGEGADSLSGLIIATATLTCVYHAMYDMLLLVLPWVGVTSGRLREQLPAWSRPIIWVALTLPAVNYLSTRTFIERFDLGGMALTIATSANGVAILVAFLLSAGIALASSLPRSAPAASSEPLST